MRFSFTHKLSSYLMLLAALAALLLSPEISRLTVALTLIGVTLSWFADPPRLSSRRYVLLWNLASIGFLAFLTVRVLGGQSLITAGVHFLLFVLINKLFNRRSSKDYQQAYVISFLMLVAATTLNTSLSYALCFVAYVVFATWSLILFHLRREMEENYLLKHSEGAQSEKVEVERILNSRRIVGGSFLAGTSLVSLGVMAVAGLIFLLFPRIGFGLFAAHRRHGVTMAGFSEQVRLGQHGRIRDNPEVVMRVIFGERSNRRKTAPPPLRWRGSVFDEYRGGIWRHSDDLRGRTALAPRAGSLYKLNYAPGVPLHADEKTIRETLMRHEIYLEPFESTVIFAADRPVALEVERPAIGGRPMFVPRRGPLGEIRASKERSSGVRYVAYSKVQMPPPRILRRAKMIRDPRWSRYLQLPTGLPKRIFELAQRITRDQPTVYDKVIAVRRYLQQNYRYTLELSHRQSLEPVDEFLFVTRRGHCEYFASAMALLLRAAGIHTRHVNGFYGGQWNPYGHYLAVRQNDAHAWTEVLLSNVGWVAFDATPAGSAGSHSSAGLLSDLQQIVDALRLRWFSYVIEYNLAKQVTLLRELRRTLAPRTTNGWRSWRPSRTHLLAAGGLLLLGLAIWWWRRLRRRRDPRASRAKRSQGVHPATRIYRRALRELARHRLPKPPALTANEFVEQLAGREHRCTPLVRQLTERYNTARFAAPTGEPTLIAEMSNLLDQLRRALRSHEGTGAAPR